MSKEELRLKFLEEIDFFNNIRIIQENEYIDWLENFIINSLPNGEASSENEQREKFCTCGNPSKQGEIYFEGDEKLIYICVDCRKQVKNNAVLTHVSKRYEYKFKAMPPQGGYATDIVEANSREEAKEILSKKYNEICWISNRL